MGKTKTHGAGGGDRVDSGHSASTDQPPLPGFPGLEGMDRIGTPKYGEGIYRSGLLYLRFAYLLPLVFPRS